MTTLQTILSLIGGILSGVLPSVGVSASITGLIGAGISAISGIITAVETKSSANAYLTVLQSAIAALKADTNLDPAVLAGVNEQITDLEAAITAYQAAETTTDPDTLTPLPPVS